MYGIFTYISLIFMVNVGNHTWIPRETQLEPLKVKQLQLGMAVLQKTSAIFLRWKSETRIVHLESYRRKCVMNMWHKKSTHPGRQPSPTILKITIATPQIFWMKKKSQTLKNHRRLGENPLFFFQMVFLDFQGPQNVSSCRMATTEFSGSRDNCACNKW